MLRTFLIIGASLIPTFASGVAGPSLAQGQIIDADYRSHLSLLFTPEGGPQRVRMPAESTGTVRVSVNEGPADEFRLEWLDEGSDAELKYDEGILLVEGRPILLTVIMGHSLKEIN